MNSSSLSTKCNKKIAFIPVGGQITRNNPKSGSIGLLAQARDWKMQVNFDQRLISSKNINDQTRTRSHNVVNIKHADYCRTDSTLKNIGRQDAREKKIQ